VDFDVWQSAGAAEEAAMMDGNTVILVGGIVVNLVVTAVVGTWKLSRVEISLREHIDQSKQNAEERVEREAKNFGEAVAALRSGLNLDIQTLRREMTEDQKFVRDTFMRRDSFYKVQETLQNDLKGLRTEIIGRLERMETKIDTKT
jgi:hypothetical protein